ncbi:MAG TPA: hypothetical protein ENG30_04255, partial [Thermofilaceae archaeon]|nr:hypothetical protein [Thermofilaceae archaeon]
MGAPEGNLPMTLGYSLAPLTLLSVHLVVEGGSRCDFLLSVLGVSALIYTHHTTLISSLAPMGIYALLALVARFRRMERAPLNYYAKAGFRALVMYGLALLISSAWLIPFILEKGYMKPSSVDNPFYFEFWSVKPLDVLLRKHGYVLYQGYTLLAAPLLAASIYAARRLEEKWRVAAMAAACYLLLALSFGKYTPLGVVYLKVPFMKFMPPLRFLSSYNLLASLLACNLVMGVGGDRRSIAAVAAIALIAIHVWDVYPHTAHFEPVELDEQYEKALRYLSRDPSMFRVFQPAVVLSQGSAISYAPAISGKDILGGWYTEASLLQSEIGWLTYLVSREESPGLVRSYVVSYALKYALCDARCPAYSRIYRSLLKAGYREDARFDYMVVLRYNESISYLRSLGSTALAIGTYSPTLARLLSSYMYIEYGGKYIDDHTVEDLSNYPIVFLYGYMYKNVVKAMSILLSYLEMGGTLVLDTWGSPDVTADNVLGLGFQSRILKLDGCVELTGLNSSRLSPFRYEGGGWAATVYRGHFDEVVVRVNDSVVVGILRVGAGRVVAVGLNLFYHALYYGNEYERNFIAGLLKIPEYLLDYHIE